MITLELLGHATVMLTTSDAERLLIDPYEPEGFGGKMRYLAIDARVEHVVCTHAHADHAAWQGLPGSPDVYQHEPDVMAGSFRVRRYTLCHDEYEGRRFGGEVDAVRVDAHGVSVLHLSDVGHSPSVADIEAIGAVDVVLVPVGGFYTMGAAQAREWCERLGARVYVPIHYKTPDCDLVLDPVEYFLGQMRHDYVETHDECICVDEARTEVICLRMTRGQEGLDHDFSCTAVTFYASKE